MSQKESVDWTPNIGKRVKVVRDQSMFFGREGKVIRDDGKHTEPYFVEFAGGFGWYEAKDLQPVLDTEKGGGV